MLNAPEISIVIPTLNGLIHLKECVLSIQDQSINNYEVIIMDGGSADGTLGFLKDLKEPFFWESKKDKGIYDAMNKGMLKAKGKWILFLGSDDKLHDKNVLHDIFKKSYPKEIELILGSIEYDFDEKDQLWVKKNRGVVRPIWSKKLWIRNTLHHQGVIYKKELLRENPFSLDYKRLSDYALNLKLYNNKTKVEIIDRIITLCGTKGVSKNYDKSLYKEEMELKVKESSSFYKPFFRMLSYFKYKVKRV